MCQLLALEQAAYLVEFTSLFLHEDKGVLDSTVDQLAGLALRPGQFLRLAFPLEFIELLLLTVLADEVPLFGHCEGIALSL